MWKWPSEEKSLGEVDSLHTLGRMDPRWFREEWGGWTPMGMRHWYRPPFSHIHGSIENGCIGKGNYYLVTSQFSLNYEYGRKGKVWTICQITWLFGAVFSEVFWGEKFQGAKSLSSWAWSVIGRFYYILVVKNPTYKSMPEVIEQYFQWVGWWSWCSGWFHVNIALFL